MKDILNNELFLRVKPIHKGWSDDKKYHVETKREKKIIPTLQFPKA